MTVCIKTGMTSEEQVAREFFRDALILTGVQTSADLAKNVPEDCEAIVSFGLCGGLSPDAQIGQAFIYDRVVTPGGTFTCDQNWQHRLFTATKYYERGCWSNGQFNTADSIQQRGDLYNSTGCWIIDDESYAVAYFAAGRQIPFVGLRVVSDGAEDNLPPAVINALNPDGSDNIEAVVSSIISDPEQIPDLIRTAQEFNISIAELRTAAIQVGQNFQWAGASQ